MSFLPDAHTLLLYSVACLILFITPGPDMSLWLAKTLGSGRRAGLFAMLGTTAGCLVHTVLAAIGVSALLAASTVAFTALKIVGGVYLLWLAISSIRKGSALSVTPLVQRQGSDLADFMTGFGINLANPKVVLFFVTFLPQFVSAQDPHATGKLLFLGAFFVVFNMPLATGIILMAERLVAWLKRRPGVLRAIDYSFAGVFGYFAWRILTTQAR